MTTVKMYHKTRYYYSSLMRKKKFVQNETFVTLSANCKK